MEEAKAMCTWCKNTGYFGDFMPGLYPLPCKQCVGIGNESVVTKSIQELMMKKRAELYSKISTQTERLTLASKLFGVNIRFHLLGLLRKDRGSLEKEQYALQEKLRNFPKDYLSIEKEALQEGWDYAVSIAPQNYRTEVKKRRERIIGKSLEEAVIMEIMDASLHSDNI